MLKRAASDHISSAVKICNAAAAQVKEAAEQRPSASVMTSAVVDFMVQATDCSCF